MNASRAGGLSRFREVFVFGPSGCAALVLSLVVLVRSLAARNAYEIVLALTVFCVWAALFLAGSWGARRLAALEPLWKPPSPFTADPPRSNAPSAHTAGPTLVTGLDGRVPWFFRLHFVVRGRFFPAGNSRGCPVWAETSAPRGSGTARLDLSFPMSGVFEGEGSCRLRDILGFFSFPCGLPRRRSFPVRSAPCLQKPFRVDARSGAEDRRNKNTADEERYYMREYAPGDRFRDINWKSSDRIDTLITRISPDNQEKISRIEVYFRNYGPSGRASLEDLWMLDRAGARLAQFLRSVREEQSSYVFNIRTSRDSREIAGQDELDGFLEELAALPFAPPRNEDLPAEGQALSASSGELYVFSTACDTGLSSFLLARQEKAVSLFFVRPPARSPAPPVLQSVPKQAEPDGSPAPESEKISVRDFAAMGFVPDPLWLFPPKNHARVLGVPALPGLVDYAEAVL
ncbi:MAG: DUF58 domain-containing protein [Treponema sp.]|jgi:hypothetical protein|nr:DUF58 domain-containing protein [Treponema sp.]